LNTASYRNIFLLLFLKIINTLEVLRRPNQEIIDKYNCIL